MDDKLEYPVRGAKDLSQIHVDEDGKAGVWELCIFPAADVPGQQVPQPLHISIMCQWPRKDVHIAKHLALDDECAPQDHGGS